MATNWKQGALEAVDHKAVETTFMQQAYGFVSNKAADLFQDPYRLGFEIVHRNDEATKMVGNFAFRVNDSALYVPVFFMNGQISGADMIYQSDVKQLVPLTKEWAKHLVSQAKKPGTLVTQEERNTPSPTNLDRLAYPQSYSKGASHADHVQAQREIENLVNTPKLTPLIPELLYDLGPGGIHKLAGLLEGQPKAQLQLAENYSPEQLQPVARWKAAAEEEYKAAMDKYASWVDAHLEEGCLKLMNDLVPDFMSKEAAEAYHLNGFAFEDTRTPEKISVIYEDDQDFESNVSSPGVYKLRLRGGDTQEALVLVADYRSDIWSIAQPDCQVYHDGPEDSYGGQPYSNFRRSRSTWVILPDGHAQRFEADKMIYGKCENDCAQGGLDIDQFVAPDKAKTGKYYIAVNTHTGEASEAFKLKGKSKYGKGYKLKVTRGFDCKTLFFSEDHMEAYNAPDSLGKFCKLVEVKASKDRGTPAVRDDYFTLANLPVDLANDRDIHNWASNSGGTPLKGKLFKNAAGLYDLEFLGVKAENLSHRGIIVKMARDLEISLAQTMTALDKVEEHKDREFPFFIAGNQDKKAFLTQLVDSEDFHTDYDSTHGVEIDFPQVEILDTRTPAIVIPDAHYGDMRQHTNFSESAGDINLPGDAFSKMSPEQLAEMADQHELPHLFDHGVVGQLATKTFDSMKQIDKYLPKLKEGLDHIGRILFLFRYKPTDFEEAFGTDDMQDTEAHLSSVFQTFGDLVLDLMRKNKDAGVGSQVVV